MTCGKKVLNTVRKSAKPTSSSMFQYVSACKQIICYQAVTQKKTKNISWWGVAKSFPKTFATTLFSSIAMALVANRFLNSLLLALLGPLSTSEGNITPLYQPTTHISKQTVRKLVTRVTHEPRLSWKELQKRPGSSRYSRHRKTNRQCTPLPHSLHDQLKDKFMLKLVWSMVRQERQQYDATCLEEK